MSVTKKVNALNAPGKSFDEKLYTVLSAMDFDQYGYYIEGYNQERYNQERYQISEIGEGMSVIEQSIMGWWKQRYLIDHNNGRAYEIMDGNMNFVNFTTEDIDWESLAVLPKGVKSRAQSLSAQFPTFIRNFSNGIAQVSWQLIPDGRYYMDEDGYGMTDDKEITVYGYIDTEMNVLVKFQYIGKDWERLKKMRSEAETELRKRKQNDTYENK
ncbi:MAG: hypothetical protein UFP03_06485 [Paludibacteraceae bacterium]|nr:hypothetical protein [Paludibacteraceae bacterium]